MKKIVFFAIAFAFLAIVVTTTSASTERSTFAQAREGSKAAVREQKIQEKVENRTDTLKQRADKEITRRIEALKKLLVKISGFKKLSATQKTTLTTQVQTEISRLTTLQAKIAADTDAATLKADIASIVTSYRIFALFMPKIEILGAADRLLNTSEEMSSQAARLETKLSEAQAKGQTVTDLQTLLTDMKAKIADAKLQGQNAINTVTPLTPEGYPANKTQLQSARQMIVTGIHDLNTARQDARKIIVGLLKLNKDRPITSVTPKLTCIPRPACLDATPSCEMPEPTDGSWCPKKVMCAQVLTPARNTTTQACKTFPTSCLEKGWVRDTTCSTTTQ